jgi:hypothetical protein
MASGHHGRGDGRLGPFCRAACGNRLRRSRRRTADPGTDRRRVGTRLPARRRHPGHAVTMRAGTRSKVIGRILDVADTGAAAGLAAELADRHGGVDIVAQRNAVPQPGPPAQQVDGSAQSAALRPSLVPGIGTGVRPEITGGRSSWLHCGCVHGSSVAPRAWPADREDPPCAPDLWRQASGTNQGWSGPGNSGTGIHPLRAPERPFCFRFLTALC